MTNKTNSSHLNILDNTQYKNEPEHLITIIKLVCSCIEHESLLIATMAIANELAAQLNFDRVSIGIVKKKHMEVFALSNSQEIDKKSNLLVLIAKAMDEAMDQQQTILHSKIDKDNAVIQIAHNKLLNLSGSQIIVTVLLIHNNITVGAILIEKFNDDNLDINLCELIAGIIAPIIKLKLDNEQSLTIRVSRNIKNHFKKIFQKDNNLKKLGYFLFISITIFLLFFKTEYRISADAILEGKIQRILAAPVKSFIATSNVRVGDVVKKDQLMATLDDKDLLLEKMKLQSKKNQLSKEYIESFATGNRSDSSIIKAKIKQVEIQLQLINEQLSRLKIIAPFSGIVIEGDLEKSSRAPVERGDILFKIAPLNKYRIILKVNESEINNIKQNQHGYLNLTSLPNISIKFKVKNITPLSIAENNTNYFRVEATALNQINKLRPGMSGVGKIEVGKRKYCMGMDSIYI